MEYCPKTKNDYGRSCSSRLEHLKSRVDRPCVNSTLRLKKLPIIV